MGALQSTAPDLRHGPLGGVVELLDNRPEHYGGGGEWNRLATEVCVSFATMMVQRGHFRSRLEAGDFNSLTALARVSRHYHMELRNPIRDARAAILVEYSLRLVLRGGQSYDIKRYLDRALDGLLFNDPMDIFPFVLESLLARALIRMSPDIPWVSVTSITYQAGDAFGTQVWLAKKYLCDRFNMPEVGPYACYSINFWATQGTDESGFPPAVDAELRALRDMWHLAFRMRRLSLGGD